MNFFEAFELMKLGYKMTYNSIEDVYYFIDSLGYLCYKSNKTGFIYKVPASVSLFSIKDFIIIEE